MPRLPKLDGYARGVIALLLDQEASPSKGAEPRILTKMQVKELRKLARRGLVFFDWNAAPPVWKTTIKGQAAWRAAWAGNE